MPAPCFPSAPPIPAAHRLVVARLRDDAVIGSPPAAVRGLAAGLELRAARAAADGHLDPLEVAAAELLFDLQRRLGPRARAELLEALAGHPHPGGRYRPARVDDSGALAGDVFHLAPNPAPGQASRVEDSVGITAGPSTHAHFATSDEVGKPA